jgi:bacterial DNA-binding protein|nr:MAG TPA: Bacterial DNA-binding protein [Caudoviricetes sp.]
MAVTKEELAVLLSEKNGSTITRSKEFIDDFIDVVISVLAGGKDINLRDNFRLKVIERKARTGYDFKEGKPIKLPSKRAIKFIPGKLFKERILECKK